MRRPARAQAAHGEGEADTLLFAVPCEFFERGGNTPAPGAHGVADVPERDFAARGLLRPWGGWEQRRESGTAGGRIAVHECHGWSPQVEAVWRSAAAIAPPAQCRPANRSSRGPEQFGISLLVEQRIQLPRVAEFDPEEPAGAQRVGVGKRRGVAQGRVDGDDFAGDGCTGSSPLCPTRSRPRRLLRQRLADVGQGHRNQVAQAGQRPWGDTDDNAVDSVAIEGVGEANPVMVFGKLHGHGRLPFNLEKQRLCWRPRRFWSAPATFDAQGVAAWP